MSTMLPARIRQELVDPLLHLCHQAGDVICDHYHAPGADEFESKSDDSPLTQADLASHAIIHAGLMKLEPGIPVLSEESPPQDLLERREWRRYWLVDPLDGTKEFLNRTGEFTINIALIEEHRPVLGVLYQPLERTAFVGLPQVEALRYSKDAAGTWQPAPLAARQLQTDQPLVLLASSRHRGPRLKRVIEWLTEHWGPVTRSNSGSALKFCQLAEARGDFYPRFSPCCEWDTAAGQALLEAAGGCLLGMDGQPVRYNCGKSLYSPHFYAIAHSDHPLWQRLLAEAGV